MYKMSERGECKLYWRRQWDIIEKLNCPTARNYGKVLDFGCDKGYFLENARRGWVRHGVEINEQARQVCEQKNIKVFADLEQLFKTEATGTYDVITMFAVIEHLVDPTYTVNVLSLFLKDNGLFVVMTGDTHSLKARWFGKEWFSYNVPDHTFYFSGDSLDAIMATVGLVRFKRIYTDGGMITLKNKWLNRLLRLGFMAYERIPLVRCLPVLDHNYSYYKKVNK